MKEIIDVDKGLDVQQIQLLLPHSYPFLLLDRVIKIKPGEYAEGIKNVSINEPYFAGHFPQNPIMPGVLIIEALAQLAAIINGTDYCNKNSSKVTVNAAAQVGYLAQVNRMKFFHIVLPGDQIILKAQKEMDHLNISSFIVSGFVKEKQVVKGKLTVTSKEQ